MAFEQSLCSISLLAAADLSANQYRAIKVDSNGKAALAGAGQFAIGILQDKPAAADRACNVAVSGVSKAVFGGTVTPGMEVAADANGKLVDAAELVVDTSDAGSATDAVIGSSIVGVALTGGAVDEIGSVLLLPGAAKATTAA